MLYLVKPTADIKISRDYPFKGPIKSLKYENPYFRFTSSSNVHINIALWALQGFWIHEKQILLSSSLGFSINPPSNRFQADLKWNLI